ncbi:hypothetical protein D9613_006715 [Agrocybe pediades]|uniref:Pyridoxamine 5'-phosphate oxidase N-terminal domain-containing protein n=1 Tax=Agrocybe pediades TaxID=84607 RepID=A0A8H4QHE0_9AGAR|nr:hypothetical protein D9613_006715 [Agrocybe pediades]
MGKFFDEIPSFLVPWIKQQKIFFVASAALSEKGHVNVSPKGFEGTFHIVDSKTVWYEDMSGSGIETTAHLKENGRMTIMFVAFEGPPRITRLFGYGKVYEFDSPEYNSLIPLEKRQPGSRSIIKLDIHKVGTSCGYSIPFFDFKCDRMKLHGMAAQKESQDIKAASCFDESDPSNEVEDGQVLPPLPENGLKGYWRAHNAKSIDGLTGLESAYKSHTVFKPFNTDWKKDDERVKADKIVRILPDAVMQWIDPKVVFAFCLGVFISGSWANILAAVGTK